MRKTIKGTEYYLLGKEIIDIIFICLMWVIFAFIFGLFFYYTGEFFGFDKGYDEGHRARLNEIINSIKEQPCGKSVTFKNESDSITLFTENCNNDFKLWDNQMKADEYVKLYNITYNNYKIMPNVQWAWGKLK